MEKSLHSGIEFKKLKIAYENFLEITFPEAPENDTLYDLYAEFVELDGYIAGIISSFINGKQIDISNLNTGDIRDKLINFTITDKQTENAVLQYINYLDRLDDLISMIKRLCDKNC